MSTKGNTKQTQGKPRNNPETTLTTGLQPGQLDKPGQHAGKQPVKPHPQRNRVESPKKPGGNRVETLLLDAVTVRSGAPMGFPNPAPPFVPNPPVPKPKPNPKPRPGPYPFTNPPKLPPPAPPPPAPRPAPWPRPAPGPVIPDVPIVPIPGLPPPGKAGGAGYLTPVSGVMRLDPTMVPVPTRQARNQIGRASCRERV